MNKNKKDTKLLDEETENLISSPVTLAWIFGLGSLMFNGEFYGLILTGQWGMALWFIFSSWLGMFIWWAIMVAVFGTWVSKGVLFKKLGRYKKYAVGPAVFIIFAIAYYIIRLHIFKNL
jgi:hypothetical protein